MSLNELPQLKIIVPVLDERSREIYQEPSSVNQFVLVIKLYDRIHKYLLQAYYPYFEESPQKTGYKIIRFVGENIPSQDFKRRIGPNGTEAMGYFLNDFAIKKEITTQDMSFSSFLQAPLI